MTGHFVKFGRISGIKDPLQKENGIKQSSDTYCCKHQKVTNLSNSCKYSCDITQQLQTKCNWRQLARAPSTPIEQNLRHPGQIQDRNGANLQHHQHTQGHKTRVQQHQHDSIRECEQAGGTCWQALVIHDQAQDEDVLSHDEDGFTVGGKRECASGKVDGGKGGAERFQGVHEDGDSGGGTTSDDTYNLGDFVKDAADEDANADDGGDDG